MTRLPMLSVQMFVRRVHRLMRPLMVIGLAFVLAACSVKPWVKPYQRDRLADPIMDAGRHGIAGSYMIHVYGPREGAKGAEGGSGGGCGCN